MSPASKPIDKVREADAPSPRPASSVPAPGASANAPAPAPKPVRAATIGAPQTTLAAGDRDASKKRAKHHKKWNRRLKIFFCCLGYKKNKDTIGDVADILAEFFADLKVSASELAAGFVLLSKYQEAQRKWVTKNKQFKIEQYLSSVPITPESNFLNMATAADSHLVNDLIYYMNYSLAIFGWPMQMIEDPCMFCCICPYLRLSPCCGGGGPGSGARRRSNKVRDRAASAKAGQTEGAGGEANEPGAADQPTADRVPPEDKLKQAECLDENSNWIEQAPESEPQPADGQRQGGGASCGASEPHKRDDTREGEDQGADGDEAAYQLRDDCDLPIILNDNCCGCNVASVERRLAAHNYEIIYVSYKVNVTVVPFLVASDHSKQSIVVAMRGSMSMSDMITDMDADVDKIPIDDCPDNWYSHRGITRAALNVKSHLENEHILDRAFNCRPDLGSQDYNLILCGHSLGAGVAAILGILMRKQYPSLRAYLYSPPGGILSLPAVEYTKEFAIGIILGNDTVPRLGIAQLERLRYHVLLSLKSSQKSAGKIIAKALCPSSCFGANNVDYDPSLSLNLLHGTQGRPFGYNGSKIVFQVQPQVLYVPGRLIHIVKNYNFKSKTRKFFNEPIYQAVWNENTFYDRIMISDGMFYDHLPHNVMHAMKMLFCKTLPARRDSQQSSADDSRRGSDKSTSISQALHGEVNNNNSQECVVIAEDGQQHSSQESDANIAIKGDAS